MAIKIIFLSVFAMNLCAFMAITFLALYLRDVAMLPGWQIASVLTIIWVIGRILPLFGGVLADRNSFGSCIVFGMLCRAVAYLGFALTESFRCLLFCSALAGLGIAIYNPAVGKAFATLPETIRRRRFTELNLVGCAGTTIGPAIGALLWHMGPRILFLVASATLGLLAVWISQERGLWERPKEKPLIAANFRCLVQDQQLLRFLACMILFFLLFVQLHYSFPLMCAKHSFPETRVAILFTIYGVVGLVSLILLRGVMIKVPPLRLVRFGVDLVALSMVMVPLSRSYAWMLACVALYSIGESFALPAADIHVAQIAKPQAEGTYFGAFEIAMGLGGTLGYFVGSWLMGGRYADTVPWLVFAGLAVVLRVCLTRLGNPADSGTAIARR